MRVISALQRRDARSQPPRPPALHNSRSGLPAASAGTSAAAKWPAL